MIRRITSLASIAALAVLALNAPSASAVAPAIPTTTFSHVKLDSARLEADVNPEGKASQYHFEYGLADCSSNPCTSTPEGKLEKGEAPKRVEALIEGLTPGTTYHFRVIAKNGKTPADLTLGPDRTFTTQRSPQVFGPCPNDTLRSGALSPLEHPSATLPDCRAYEQVSPVDKNGGDVIGRVAWLKASPAGDAVSFMASSGIPGGEGGQELPAYIARRSATGWSSQGMLPPAAIGEEAFVPGWTPDFSQVFSWSARLGSLDDATFLSRSAEGPLTTLVPYGSGLSKPYFAGSSADGSLVFFESTSKLPGTQGIQGKSNVYAWDRESGKVSLASVQNDGAAPIEGAFAGSYAWMAGTNLGALTSGGSQANFYTQDNHAISTDGSLYFTVAGSAQLYLRENPTKEQSATALNGKGEEECTEPEKACTIHVSASQKDNGPGDGTDAAGTRPAAFMAASADGSKVFFTSPEKLTNNATTGPEPEAPAIGRADIGGEAPSIQADFLPDAATGIAVFGGYIYWADPGKGTIGRAKLNGEDPATERKPDFITGAQNPRGVAVDGSHIYWTNAADGADGTGTIGRADIDGNPASVNQSCVSGASNPQGIAVGAGFVYWANGHDSFFDSHSLGRAGAECTGADQDFIDLGLRNPAGVAVDASHLYWTIDHFGPDPNGFVVSADLDGGNQTFKFMENNTIESPGLALDAAHVYWAQAGTNTIGRANLDLSGVEQGFISADGNLNGLALDGEHIYWSANGEIAPNPGNDLYRYGADTGELTDLTPDGADPDGADVKGVLGTSVDGSYVYFAANGDLDGGGPATVGDCRGTADSFVNFEGQCNLYLAHAGTIDFIARLDSVKDATNWLPRGGLTGRIEKTARVTPDGRTLLFSSTQQLTSYENEGEVELYRYRAGEPGLICVSCHPTGEAPAGRHRLGYGTDLGDISFAQLIPSDPAFTLSRNLSDSGDRVFFETTEALLPADTNGEEGPNGEDGCPLGGNSNNANYPVCKDVYEWEAKGSGSCESEAQNGGCLYLLSSGKSDRASFLLDASASGDDAFLITRSPFVGQDGDQLYDVYDARANGGLAAQSEVAPVPCEGEACKPGAPAPPQSRSAGSATFSGPPNPKARKPKPRCPKSKRTVKAKGKTRCVARHHKRATGR